MIKYFESEEDAKRERDEMHGWARIKVRRVHDPMLGGAAPGGRPWYLETEGGVLCTDGYIRQPR